MAAFQKYRMVVLAFWCLMAILPGLASAEDERTSPGQEIMNLLIMNKNETLTLQQEQALAKWLRIGTDTYLKKVKVVGFWSFKGRRDISAELAVSLVSNAEGIAEGCENMLRWLSKPEKTPDVYSALAWTRIAGEISVHIVLMYELMNFKIVDSEWPMYLYMNLRAMFDKLLYDKLLELSTRAFMCDKEK